MTPVLQGALDRSIRGMTIDTIRNLDQRREMLGYDEMGELEQQFQIDVQGTAGSIIGWVDFDLTFGVDFYNAPNRRNSPYTLPHFTYGYLLTTPDPVVLTACVRSYKLDDKDTVQGASISIGAYDPGSTKIKEFTGVVHLVFQGYGAPVENFADIDVGGAS